MIFVGEVDQKGRVVIPYKLRRNHNITSGNLLAIEVNGNGVLKLTKFDRGD